MPIVERWRVIREQVDSATKASGREVSAVELLAVSKTYPSEVIAEVIAAGQRSLGENRVQEALEKMPQLEDEISWHLIGPLQRNKVRKVVGKFACLQGVDSLKLAQTIDRVAGELGIVQSIFLQVKVGGEETKSGFEFSELTAQMDSLRLLSNLRIRGLMTIPPPVFEPEEARPYFAQTREFRDQLETSSGLKLSQLSMGMSGDYEGAIAEGSTMVRIGSAIFGRRV